MLVIVWFQHLTVFGSFLSIVLINACSPSVTSGVGSLLVCLLLYLMHQKFLHVFCYLKELLVSSIGRTGVIISSIMYLEDTKSVEYKIQSFVYWLKAISSLAFIIIVLYLLLFSKT